MPQGKQYRVSGALFQRDRGPAFSGFVEIDGVKTYISLWEKVSGSGTTYWQVSEDRKPPGQNQQVQQPSRFPPNRVPGPTTPAAPQRFYQGSGPVTPQAKPSNRPIDDDFDDSIPF